MDIAEAHQAQAMFREARACRERRIMAPVDPVKDAETAAPALRVVRGVFGWIVREGFEAGDAPFAVLTFDDTRVDVRVEGGECRSAAHQDAH